MSASTARERIWQRILAAARRSSGQDSTRQPLTERAVDLIASDGPPEALQLARVDDPLVCFVREARASGAEVVELSSIEALPREVFARSGRPARLAIAAQASLGDLDWPCATDADVRTGAGWAVVTADAGIAETGSLCFIDDRVSSELLFLAEYLACVVCRSDIVARQEQVWRKMLGAPGARRAPRALHQVTGPSRTADVEQTLQVGAHGPREVVIYLLPD